MNELPPLRSTLTDENDGVQLRKLTVGTVRVIYPICHHFPHFLSNPPAILAVAMASRLTPKKILAHASGFDAGRVSEGRLSSGIET
ncbi:MAG: hypothetical protein ABI353_06415 [Isosphaeraceae bacterium]